MSYKTDVYFLGEATSDGFKTGFTQQMSEKDFYTYILKGGPGTGKSGLMKKIAKAFEKKDNIDIYYCSSDPNSLDAVVLKNAKIAVIDGTAPHVFDADYPGASQSIINLGDCWNADSLKKNSDMVHGLIDENLLWHARVRKYLNALSSLNSDILTVGELALVKPKLEAFAGRYIKKILPKPSLAGNGKLLIKKLSAITQNGYMTLLPDGYIPIVIDDNCFAAGDTLLRSIVQNAVQKGYTVTVSLFRLVQRDIYEHVLIPELGIAFYTRSFFNEIELNESPKINMERFYNKQILSEKKQRLNFDKKACLELKSEAADSILKAKRVHDDLESYYINAVDFKMVDEITEKLIDRIKKSY